MSKRQFIVTIEGEWLDGDKKVTAAQVAADLRQTVKREFQFLAKRTSVKRIPVVATAAQDATSQPLTRCAAGRDGECAHAQCPQLRDSEPGATGRHCPLDTEAPNA